MENYNPEGIPGIVSIIEGDLYAQTPKSLSALIDHLTRVGYDIRDVSSEEGLFRDKPPREVQEKQDWFLWYGKLNDSIFERKAECRSCNNLIDARKAHIHENKCDFCENYTSIKYANGGQIRFDIPDDRPNTFGNLTLVIYNYDKDNEQLNFYSNPQDCHEKIEPFIIRSYFSRSMEDSYKIINQAIKRFPKTFMKRKINGVKVITTPYRNDMYVAEHGINSWDISGERKNFDIVQLFKGEKFKEWDRLPIPTGVHIYEAWHWAPLKPSDSLYKKIMNAAGQNSEKGSYYQDGRPRFSQTQINWMLKFIDKFTTIDVNSVKNCLHTGLSGPSLIDILAKKTGHEEAIETKPNIGNALIFLSKTISGEHMTIDEQREGIKSIIHDRENDNLLGNISKKSEKR